MMKKAQMKDGEGSIDKYNNHKLNSHLAVRVPVTPLVNPNTEQSTIDQGERRHYK